MAPPPPPQQQRGPPLDRWAGASSSAIASGFFAAMGRGAQPHLKAAEAAAYDRQVSDTFAATDEEDDEEDDGDDADLSPGGAGPSTRKRAKKAAQAAEKSKKDRKNAQQIRKDQNRAAQREFRQRKQQYIRALEARIELHTTGHDAQVDRLRWILRPLLSENQVLRKMVSDLSEFIGKRSIGGYLSEAGLSKADLAEAIGSSSEKTMTEAWFSWPHATECEELTQIRKDCKIPLDGLPDCKLYDMFGDPADLGKGNKVASANSDGKRNAHDASSSCVKRVRHPPTASSENATSSRSRQYPPHPESSYPDPAMTTLATAGPVNNQRSTASEAWSRTDGQDHPYAQDLYQNGLPANPALLYSSNMTHNSLFAASSMNFLPTYDATSGVSTVSILTEGSNKVFPASAAATPILRQAYSTSSENISVADIGAPLDPAKVAVMRANGVELPGSEAASTEVVRRAAIVRDVHTRIGRVVTLVNRIRAKRGAVKFLCLPVNILLTDIDHKAIDNEGEYSPQMKLAMTALPNGWDEGDLSPQNESFDRSYSFNPPETSEDYDRLLAGLNRLEYHMINYRMDPSYKLPAVLEPSALQRSTPHDTIISAVPWASVRDKLIQNSYHKYESVVLDVLRFIKLNVGDADLEQTWELSYPFLIRYPDLIPNSLLVNINRARNSRGQSALTMDFLWDEHRRLRTTHRLP